MAGSGSSGEAPLPRTRLEGVVVPPTRFDGGVDEGSGGGDATEVSLPRALRGSYVALSDMASGGEGDLVLVRHVDSGELRVVKIYRGMSVRDERVWELLAGAEVDHVVRIFREDSGHGAGGRWWEVMEYCAEGSLADLIRREGLVFTRERIVEVVRELVAALDYLHGLHIPHRDLKPGNVLVRRVEPLDLVLADFGRARVIEATKEMHSRVISAHYASPQAINGAVSPAMDWWALGIIVAEMARGRHPFQTEDGRWLADALTLDWIQSRPIDLSGIDDARVELLCRGLTVRDDRPGWRWGSTEVHEWLDGGSPALAAEQEHAVSVVSASPFPFVDPATGHSRPFSNPVELAGAMAQKWDAALELLGGSGASRADQRALRNFLRSVNLAAAEQILAEQDDAEERLTRLLVQLDPAIAPTFRGYSVDRNGLRRLALSDSESARSALGAILQERILLNYSRSQDHADLANLDSEWHEEVAAFEKTISSVKDSSGQPIMRDPVELATAKSQAGALILAALLDADVLRTTADRAQEALRDSPALRQPWFSDIARADRPDRQKQACHSATILVLQPIATALSRQQDDAKQQATREKNEREQATADKQREERRVKRRAGNQELREALIQFGMATATLVVPYAVMFLFVFKGHTSVNSSEMNIVQDLVSIVCGVVAIGGIFWVPVAGFGLLKAFLRRLTSSLR